MAKKHTNHGSKIWVNLTSLIEKTAELVLMTKKAAADADQDAKEGNRKTDPDVNDHSETTKSPSTPPKKSTNATSDEASSSTDKPQPPERPEKPVYQSSDAWTQVVTPLNKDKTLPPEVRDSRSKPSSKGSRKLALGLFSPVKASDPNEDPFIDHENPPSRDGKPMNKSSTDELSDGVAGIGFEDISAEVDRRMADLEARRNRKPHAKRNRESDGVEVPAKRPRHRKSKSVEVVPLKDTTTPDATADDEGEDGDDGEKTPRASDYGGVSEEETTPRNSPRSSESGRDAGPLPGQGKRGRRGAGGAVVSGGRRSKRKAPEPESSSDQTAPRSSSASPAEDQDRIKRPRKAR
ncbi:MAG: hypothetical protein M1829_006772 [Trizodia sp. TS-e1964]|nr:MAG: hypothetical protein M1829_006772 [Trizodia sp. TS-e1964]